MRLVCMSLMNETGITNVLAGMINRANKNDAINKPRFIAPT